MITLFKYFLKRTGLYHPLQRGYRHLLFLRDRSRSRKAYVPYRGEGWLCNVCWAHYSRFVPCYPEPQNAEAIRRHGVIAGYGEAVFCPNCRSSSRERLILALLQSRNDLAGKKVLHCAPEKNIYDFLKDRTAITTADYLHLYYRSVDPDVQFADLLQLPFPSHSFDLVIANHVLEHVPDDRRAMRELHRVLKEGGEAILQVPFSTTIETTLEEPGIKDGERQSNLFGQKDHVRIYALHDYLQRLREAGFRVEYLPYESLKDFHRFAVQPGEGFILIRK